MHLVLLFFVLILVTGCGEARAPLVPVEVMPAGIEVIQRLADAGPVRRDVHLQGQALELNQTIEGITITVHWVYADAEQALVGYSVHSANGRRHDPRGTRLIFPDGREARSVSEIGIVGTSEIFNLTLPEGQSAHLAQFAASRVQDMGSGAMRFVVETEEFVAPPAQPPTMWNNLLAFFGQQQAPQDMRVEAQPAPRGITTGPFTFEIEFSTE